MSRSTIIVSGIPPESHISKSAILTPHRFHDHEEHRRFFRNHFLVKGRELAETCLRMLALNNQLTSELPKT